MLDVGCWMLDVGIPVCWMSILFSGDGLEKFWPMVLEKFLVDVGIPVCWMSILFSGDGLEKFWPMVWKSFGRWSWKSFWSMLEFLYVGGVCKKRGSPPAKLARCARSLPKAYTIGIGILIVYMGARPAGPSEKNFGRGSWPTGRRPAENLYGNPTSDLFQKDRCAKKIFRHRLEKVLDIGWNSEILYV